jgi:hypothetical protein
MSRLTNAGGDVAAAARYRGRNLSSTRRTVPAVSHVEICDTRDDTLTDT